MGMAKLPGKKYEDFEVRTDKGNVLCRVNVKADDAGVRFYGLTTENEQVSDATLKGCHEKLTAKQLAADTRVWVRYLRVTFQLPMRDRKTVFKIDPKEHSFDLCLEARIDFLEVSGTGPKDKTAAYRHVNADGSFARWASGSRESGWPEVGVKKDRYSYARTIALILDTPDNRAALLALRWKVDALANRLGSMFEPDKVDELLASLLVSHQKRLPGKVSKP